MAYPWLSPRALHEGHRHLASFKQLLPDGLQHYLVAMATTLDKLEKVDPSCARNVLSYVTEQGACPVGELAGL